VILGFLLGWRWAALVYFAATVVEEMCVATGSWTLQEAIWFSNLAPTIIIAFWLVPLLAQARNWRPRRQTQE
jgi:hypothetical protein